MNFKLLPTMWKIIKQISLPDCYWITPENHNTSSILKQCSQHIADGKKMIQLRSKLQLDTQYIEKFNQLCQLNGVKLILNMPQMNFREPCDGWHLTTQELLNFSPKELSEKKAYWSFNTQFRGSKACRKNVFGLYKPVSNR